MVLDQSIAWGGALMALRSEAADEAAVPGE
jgi:hypothetical protein